jgi:hypothetical protein
MKQVLPWAPWEIRRSDLDSDPVRSILDNLKKTGKLVLEGDRLSKQPALPFVNQGNDNDRHCS